MVFNEERKKELSHLVEETHDNISRVTNTTTEVSKLNSIFTGDLINISKSISLADYNIHFLTTFSFTHNYENFTPQNITCDNLHKQHKSDGSPENATFDLPDNLRFNFRIKLSKVFDNYEITYNKKLADGTNMLEKLIPEYYDIEFNTYKPILEHKTDGGIFVRIQLDSYPLHANLDYKNGLLIFFQKNIEITNSLLINDEEIYLSFIRFEGIIGDIQIGSSSDANLQNWSDVSFNNVDISINGLITMYNTFNFSDLCDNNVPTKSQIKQLAENNFFFFFQSRPWPPIYLDGSFIIPYSYNYGNLNSSIYNPINIDIIKISDSANYILYNNLELYFKIANRRPIIWNYNDLSVNYVPEYNVLYLEYRDNSNQTEFTSDFSGIDASINPFFIPNRQDYSIDISTTFNLIFNIDRANQIYPDPLININIRDSSNVDITINSFNFFKRDLGYQFRVYLTNSSDFDISRTPGYIINQFEDNDPSWNYLYFPDLSNSYFISLPKGRPNPPSDLQFFDVSFESFFIKFFNLNTYVDENSVQPLNSNDISLVYNIEISASMITNYRRAIDFSSYLLELSFINLQDSSFVEQVKDFSNVLPEFNYRLRYDSFYINYYSTTQNDYSFSDVCNIDLSINTLIPINNFNYNNFLTYEISNNIENQLINIRIDPSNNNSFYLRTKYNNLYSIIFTDNSFNFNFLIDISNIIIGDICNTINPNTNPYDISIGSELIDNSLQNFNFKILEISNSVFHIYENSLNILLTDFSTTDISNSFYIQNKLDGSINAIIKDNFPNIQDNKSHYYLHGDLSFNFNYILYRPNDISFYNFIEVSFNQYNYINNNFLELKEISLNSSYQETYIHVIPDSSDVSYNYIDESLNYNIILDTSWGLSYEFFDTSVNPNKNYNIRSFNVYENWNYSISADFSLGELFNIGNSNIDNSNLVRYYFDENEMWYNNNDWLITYYLENKTNQNIGTSDICFITISGSNNFNTISYTILNNYDFSSVEEFNIRFDLSYINNLFNPNFFASFEFDASALKLEYISPIIDFSYGGWLFYAEDFSKIFNKIELYNNPHRSCEYTITYNNTSNNKFIFIEDFCHNNTDLKYNQLMYGENNKFTSGISGSSSSNIYKLYEYPTDISFYGRVLDFSSFEYNLFDDSGDIVEYTIPQNNYFYDEYQTNVSGIYKWLSFSLDNSTNKNTLIINSPNDSSNILYYLILQTDLSAITAIGNGNVRQRDIGTYYIPTDNCNNISIWMPFKNYVSLNGFQRYLSIPNDACNNLYLITGIPNDFDLSFSSIIYDLSDISFGNAKTPYAEIIISGDLSNNITISGGVDYIYSNITNNLAWPTEKFTDTDISVFYNIEYITNLSGNIIDENYKRGFLVDSINYNVTILGSNLSSNKQFFTISFENIAHPEFIYNINNLIMRFSEDNSYDSNPYNLQDISFRIPDRQGGIIQIESNNINYILLPTSQSEEIETQILSVDRTRSSSATYFINDLSINVNISKNNLSIFRKDENDNELIGNELYDKSLNRIKIDINQNYSNIIELSNNFYNIGLSSEQFFNIYASGEISYNFDISNKIVIFDHARYDISYNRGYYLSSDLSIDYIFDISRPSPDLSNLYDYNFDISLIFEFYKNNTLHNYSVTKSIKENFVLKKDINSVEISFTYIDISLDYSDFGISFELSGNTNQDFSFVYGVKRGWNYLDLSKIDISYSFDLSISQIDLPFFRYNQVDWSYNLNLIKNYNSTNSLIFEISDNSYGNIYISKSFDLSNSVHSDNSSIFYLNISANVVQNIGVDNSYIADPSIIYIDKSVNIIFDPSLPLKQNTINAIDRSNIEIIHKLSRPSFDEYYFDFSGYNSSNPIFPNLPFDGSFSQYYHDTSVNNGQCILYNNNFTPSGDPYRILYYPNNLGLNPTISFENYSVLNAFHIPKYNPSIRNLEQESFPFGIESILDFIDFSNNYGFDWGGNYKFVIKKILDPQNIVNDQFISSATSKIYFNNININDLKAPDYIFLINFDGIWFDCTFKINNPSFTGTAYELSTSSSVSSSLRTNSVNQTYTVLFNQHTQSTILMRSQNLSVRAPSLSSFTDREILFAIGVNVNINSILNIDHFSTIFYQ